MPVCVADVAFVVVRRTTVLMLALRKTLFFLMCRMPIRGLEGMGLLSSWGPTLWWGRGEKGGGLCVLGGRWLCVHERLNDGGLRPYGRRLCVNASVYDGGFAPCVGGGFASYEAGDELETLRRGGHPLTDEVRRLGG